MIVRCGRCSTQFEVQGPGRYSCPSCGTANEVGTGPPPGPGMADIPPVESAPEPKGPPPQQVECRECGHAFFVGDVAVAPCPNCRTPIEVGPGEAT